MAQREPNAGQPNQAQWDRGSSFQADLERDKAHRRSMKSLKPLRRLVPFLVPYRLTLALFVVFLVLAAGLSLVFPAASRLLVDCGFAGGELPAYCAAFGGAEGQLAPYFLLGIVIAGLLGVGSAMRFYLISRLGERVVADIRRAVYDHIMGLSLSFFEKTRTGEVLSRLTTDTTLVQTVVGSSVSIALRTLATTLGALIMMAVVNLKLTLMVLAIGPLILGPLILFGRRIQRLSRRAQDELAGASARASESLSAIETVQAFTQESAERASFGGAIESTFQAALARIRVRAVMTALLFSLVLTTVTLVLWFGAVQVKAGALTGGEMLQFMLYAFMAVSGVGMLTETWSELLRAAGATERLTELLVAPSDIAAPASPAVLPAPLKGELAFSGVRFSYPTRPDEDVLRDVSFTVAPGETVALVGPSGAGKSTIFQLIQRFYDPQGGGVTLDGVDVRSLDPQVLRTNLSAVQQNAPLFSGSAFENIAYGRPPHLGAADRHAVAAAAREAIADGFIDALPDGYDTDLGERGVTLSGGQRQRIAIARAILRDAPVLLLDEATSALDAESERAVQEAFTRLAKGRTTLVIAHRLATILQADRILVMDQGQIVEEGTHERLVAQGGLYARLARLQFAAGVGPADSSLVAAQ